MDQSMNESSSSSDSECAKGMKRLSKKDKWFREKAKRRRQSGKSYVTKKKDESGKTTKEVFHAGKLFSPVTECCSKECFKIMNKVDQKDQFESFYSNNKEDQDTFLMGIIEQADLKRPAANPKSNNRTCSWKYNVKISGKKEKVCKSLLKKLYQVSDDRLRTVQSFLQAGQLTAIEQRGKHHNRPHKIPQDVWKMIQDHWASFPSKKSHYSRNKTERKYFDNPDLNVQILFQLFQEYYKNKTGEDLTMKYPTYHLYFRKNSPYSFRCPRSDVCDFCSKCKVKLDGNPDDSCKSSYEEHLKKVKDYAELKRKYVIYDKEIGSYRVCEGYEDTLILEFDYAQNLVLPKLNTNSHYYKRILNMYVFNIHCYNDNESKMYNFLECNGKKDSNSVCSFLENFIKKKLLDDSKLKKIILFSDSAGGQNKNAHIVKFCTWLSQKWNVDITQIFPVRGHSYCQCDRNFGLYGTILKRKEKIESPQKYLDIMRAARKKQKPFEAEMSSDLLRDWVTSLNAMYKKTPKLSKNTFAIQKYVKIAYKPSSEVLVYRDYGNSSLRFANLPKTHVTLDLLPVKKPGITDDKKKDLQFFLPFLEVENRQWLQEVLDLEEQNLETNNVISDEESDFED